MPANQVAYLRRHIGTTPQWLVHTHGIFLFGGIGSDSLYQLLVFNLGGLVLDLLIAFSIVIALLRYELWNIDFIINRTLVYGTLTGTLALLYVGLVFGLQSLVHVITGQVSQSPIVIVASTLAIATLIRPLLPRIQAIIDRRFYRRKYDAAKTLEAFSATLRNEVDLTQLREHLLAVVEETMQSAHVSLWLCTPQSTVNKQAVSNTSLKDHKKRAEV